MNSFFHEILRKIFKTQFLVFFTGSKPLAKDSLTAFVFFTVAIRVLSASLSRDLEIVERSRATELGVCQVQPMLYRTLKLSCALAPQVSRFCSPISCVAHSARR